ncbi:hypothetical protein CLOSTMETH_00600, partial [[Clostridium] methylpentosum DSM 5476]
FLGRCFDAEERSVRESEAPKQRESMLRITGNEENGFLLIRGPDE